MLHTYLLYIMLDFKDFFLSFLFTEFKSPNWFSLSSVEILHLVLIFPVVFLCTFSFFLSTAATVVCSLIADFSILSSTLSYCFLKFGFYLSSRWNFMITFWNYFIISWVTLVNLEQFIVYVEYSFPGRYIILNFLEIYFICCFYSESFSVVISFCRIGQFAVNFNIIYLASLNHQKTLALPYITSSYNMFPLSPQYCQSLIKEQIYVGGAVTDS